MCVAFFSYADMEAEAYNSEKNANDVSQHLLIDACADLEYFVDNARTMWTKKLAEIERCWDVV